MLRTKVAQQSGLYLYIYLYRGQQTRLVPFNLLRRQKKITKRAEQRDLQMCFERPIQRAPAQRCVQLLLLLLFFLFLYFNTFSLFSRACIAYKSGERRSRVQFKSARPGILRSGDGKYFDK